MRHCSSKPNDQPPVQCRTLPTTVRNRAHQRLCERLDASGATIHVPILVSCCTTSGHVLSVEAPHGDGRIHMLPIAAATVISPVGTTGSYESCHRTRVASGSLKWRFTYECFDRGADRSEPTDIVLAMWFQTIRLP